MANIPKQFQSREIHIIVGDNGEFRVGLIAMTGDPLLWDDGHRYFERARSKALWMATEIPVSGVFFNEFGGSLYSVGALGGVCPHYTMEAVKRGRKARTGKMTRKWR